MRGEGSKRTHMTRSTKQPGGIDEDIFQATAMAKVIIGKTTIKKLIEDQLLEHPVIKEQHEAIQDGKKAYENKSADINQEGSQGHQSKASQQGGSTIKQP